MPQDSLKIFILGVTGYVGGPLLRALKKAYPNAHYSALIRSEAHIPIFRAEGVQEIIHGSSSDTDKLRKACSEADVVFAVADCDDVPMAQAVLAGLKDNFEKTGRRPVLIHTSGSALVMDRSQGIIDRKLAAAPCDDADEENIKRIPPEALHRNVDNLIFAADKEGYVDAWIVSPPTLYGESNGPLVRGSKQIPIIVNLALAAGKAFTVNEGSARWDNMHVQDLVDFFILLTQKALSPEATRASPYSKFYFLESSSHSWGELTKLVAEAMYKRGVLPTKEVTPLSFEEAMAIDQWAFGVMTNSFTKASKAHQLGWTPKHVDWRAEIDGDVERYLKTLGKI
ncbi:NAD(P)-binding protein [Exidia glandulosa HHB12029]|uniref:NAD(P)-binding protein n=1 Tax=Exidia glandulosa HHB12029 TaxID=1314781 RepID=A0A165PNR1_EXIGL|nr:NAD(P)-binding protein [Exidia glandulosa HHB12029]